MADKLLTLKEASGILNISENDLQKLVDKGDISAYKIGGSYLRFKSSDISSIKNNLGKLNDKKFLKGNLSNLYDKNSDASLKRPERAGSSKGSFFEKIRDFFYFNSFYIVVVALLAALIVIIFKKF